MIAETVQSTVERQVKTMSEVVERTEVSSSILSIVPSDEGALWNADWIIYLKQEGETTQIGKVSFAGEKEYGEIPFYIELKEEYRNQGYGTQAIRMMTGWAFKHGPVYEITAVTEHSNDKAVRALKKAGFVYREGDRRVETYSMVKPKTNWLGLYVIIGICVGLVLGVVISNSYIGLGIGLVVSVILGGSMDVASRKEREKITGKKEYSRKKK